MAFSSVFDHSLSKIHGEDDMVKEFDLSPYVLGVHQKTQKPSWMKSTEAYVR